MKQIKFDSKKSYDDFGLKLREYAITPPEAKKLQEDNPGGNGVIDQTEWLGYPTYKNRSAYFIFDLQATNMVEMEEKLSDIYDVLNGAYTKVYIGDDHYYEGRLTITPEPINNLFRMVKIDCDFYPYKLKETETVVQVTAISAGVTVDLQNEKMPAMPTIKATAPVTLVLRGVTSSIPESGEFIIPDMQLLEGSNEVTVSGSGTVTFTYREGRF